MRARRLRQLVEGTFAVKPPIEPDPASVATVGSVDADLRYSYEQVLDATKHQDDKINRLLTAISFLTAGSIALASFAQAAPARSWFQLGPASEAGSTPQAPLALIALGSFLVGVVGSVLMLIASLTTPLRFPGGSRPLVPDIPYVDRTRVGQVYFFEIERASLLEWFMKWKRGRAELSNERRESLIRETHNLAVRTASKYRRTSEAVALMNFALFSLALAAMLILSAGAVVDVGAGGKAPVVRFADFPNLALALVVFGYVALQLLTARRDADVRRGLGRKEEGFSWWVRVGRVSHPWLVAAVPALLVAQRDLDSRGLFAYWGTIALAVTAFLCSLPWSGAGREGRRLEAARGELRRELGDAFEVDGTTRFDIVKSNIGLSRNSVAIVLVGLAYAYVGWTAEASGDYVRQFVFGVASGVLLLAWRLPQIWGDDSFLKSFDKRLANAVMPARPAL